MASQPVVFGEMVQSVKKALGRQLSPEVAKQLLAVGVDLDHLQVAYPLAQWHQALKIMGDALAGEVAPDDRIRQLGRLFVRSFVQSGLGLAVFSFAKVLGVRRTLMRTGRNFRTVANYADAEVTEVGPKEVRIRTFVIEEFLPHVGEAGAAIVDYRRGTLEEICAVLGAKATVALVDSRPERGDGTFHITWD